MINILQYRHFINCFYVVLQDMDSAMLDHPLSDVAIAGDSVHPLPTTFHSFLQTIADVMMYLPGGSTLQVRIIQIYNLN